MSKIMDWLYRHDHAVLGSDIQTTTPEKLNRAMEAAIVKYKGSSGKVYLSGPITGLTYGEARYTWRELVAAELARDGIEVLSPMRHEGHLAEMRDPIQPDNLPNHFFSHSKMLVMKDFLDIDVSDIVLVNLLGAKAVSQGTIIEMGYAYAKQKPIVVVREGAGNVHNSPFVGELGIVLPSLEQATIVIRSLLSTGV